MSVCDFLHRHNWRRTYYTVMVIGVDGDVFYASGSDQYTDLLDLDFQRECDYAMNRGEQCVVMMVKRTVWFGRWEFRSNLRMACIGGYSPAVSHALDL